VDFITVNVHSPPGTGVYRDRSNQFLEWVIGLIISFVGTKLDPSLCSFRLFDGIAEELDDSGHDGLV
jgi:hypothetical protein